MTRTCSGGSCPSCSSFDGCWFKSKQHVEHVVLCLLRSCVSEADGIMEILARASIWQRFNKLPCSVSWTSAVTTFFLFCQRLPDISWHFSWSKVNLWAVDDWPISCVLPTADSPHWIMHNDAQSCDCWLGIFNEQNLGEFVTFIDAHRAKFSLKLVYLLLFFQMKRIIFWKLWNQVRACITDWQVACA